MERSSSLPEVTLLDIAKRTAGFSGADLENLMNELAILAARRNKTGITMQETWHCRWKPSHAELFHGWSHNFLICRLVLFLAWF